MIGDLKINNKDAYSEWGISLSEGGLTSLLTPPSMKALVENESRATDGKQVYNLPKVNSRTITLEIHFCSSSQDDFFAKYTSFCEELKTGKLDIWTKYQPEVLYRCYYLSCSQFSQFNFGIAKFSLKLEEINPNDRTFLE